MAMVAETGAAHEEGDEVILWVLVWSELAAFGVLIAGFMVASFLHPESFSIAKLHLNGRLASFNTLVLITSGWLAAEAARASSPAVRRWTLVGSASLGFLFAAVKLAEYRSELRYAGDATFNAFFELYFLITGFHFAHVVFIGLLMLIVAIRPNKANVTMVTTVWHVVDIVWLVIFPVVYLG